MLEYRHSDYSSKAKVLQILYTNNYRTDEYDINILKPFTELDDKPSHYIYCKMELLRHKLQMIRAGLPITFDIADEEEILCENDLFLYKMRMLNDTLSPHRHEEDILEMKAIDEMFKISERFTPQEEARAIKEFDEMIRMASIDIKEEEEDNFTIDGLKRALKNGNVEKAKDIIDHGVSITSIDSDFIEKLLDKSMLSKNSILDIVEFLLKNGYPALERYDGFMVC